MSSELANFPNFKLLELTDCEAVLSITSKLPPYSDFNFVSIWSWNLYDKIMISQLNGNLVVKFTDYITGESFYSFIGNTEVEKTTKELLEFCREQTGKTHLKLIPESTRLHISDALFNIEEDVDNFDYIYDTNELRQLAGKKFSQKRNRVQGFMRDIPHAYHEELSLSDSKVQQEIRSLLEYTDSVKQNTEAHDSHNAPVFEKLLQTIDLFDIITTGVYVDSKLAAIFISELTGDNFSIGHIMSADTGVHKGIYTYLMMKNAELLHQKGAKVFNFEQDLGIENLRIAKSRFRPIGFLKKHRISFPQ